MQVQTPNRLINETSPYLLQHAGNPVDWFPWSREAFEKAEMEDKPIFLSIGYSSCHWCHVMEREVFEIPQAAQALSDFISIKVDREERGDVDALYMEVCQLMTGSGGWPLSIFMTPDKQPFFAATYLQLDHFCHLAGQITVLWKADRNRLFQISRDITHTIAHPSDGGKTEWDFMQAAHSAYASLKGDYDPENGGFGKAPKFPSPHSLMFLQRYGLLVENSQALQMAQFTLERMSLGGIFDQIGGGFCRYSTDERYLTPHFEKMLYDNAMLSTVYAEFGFFEIAGRTIDFCMRELYCENIGAFYTAIDADSEGQEGKSYLFTRKEVISELGQDDGTRFCRIYDITEQGNFEGKNIPNMLKTGKLSEEDESFAAPCRSLLLHARSRRAQPFRDEKITLGPNALMLAALATCGRLMGREGYINAAVKLARFIRREMALDNRLRASWKNAASPHLAISDDYAYLAWGLYRLHQATLDDTWLIYCREVCDDMLSLFSSSDGLLFLSGKDVDDLPVRTKNIYDGALPSGNAVAAGVFRRLHTLTGEDIYAEALQRITRAMGAYASNTPTAHTALLANLLLSKKNLKAEIPVSNENMSRVWQGFHPFVSFSAGENGNSAAVCSGDRCFPPVDTAEDLEKLL
ncbi:MAG: thioredoxin domain-containing protein [Oscillospiraceae bacterium]|nr:thioredoxin domain-containing protein [Oscillospiraceae bacterium]